MKNKKTIGLILFIIVIFIFSSTLYILKQNKKTIENTTDFLIEGSSYIIIDVSELKPIDISEWEYKYKNYNLTDQEELYYEDIVKYCKLYNEYISCDSIEKSKKYEGEILDVYDRILFAYKKY